MVTYPWYVFHIPGTHTYVPIWTVAIGAFLLLAVASAAVSAIYWVSSPPPENR